jgi:arabinogalactan endo-1,4-beta-galactosidase
MNRLLVAGLTVAAVGLSAVPATAAVSPVSPPPKDGWAAVDPGLFGMHVTQLADTDFPGKIGGVRLWDSGVRWDQIEKQRGQYDWDRLDRAVANAQKAGARDIVYVLGSTPEWAAKQIDPQAFYYGGGTASDVKSLSMWRDWVRAVATRYKGRITSYQIWNEANLASFWAPQAKGNWKRMARLTEIAADEIRAIDRRAKIASASSTVIQAKRFSKESFFYRYLRSVKKRKIDLDAISVHLYPWTTKGPGGGRPVERLSALELARQVMSDVGLSRVPMWDTEVNYGNRRDNGHPREVFTPKVGAAYLARTYVDSARYGVTKVFWYAWDSHVMGISTTDPDTGEVIAPGRAFFTVEDWMSGAKWGGCSDQRVTVCALKRKGERQYILYANLGTTRTVKVPKRSFDVRQVCTVDGECSRIANRTVRVNQAPVLLTP